MVCGPVRRAAATQLPLSESPHLIGATAPSICYAATAPQTACNNTLPLSCPLPRYCPVPVDTWGLRRVDQGCQLDSWLVPTGCVLPPPPPVWPPLLGRWERQSQPLAVNKNARQAISDFLPYFEQVGRGSGGHAELENKLTLYLASLRLATCQRQCEC